MTMISAKGVRKVYRTGASTVEALRGVDLSVPRGVLAVVMGPSGSGKSTLLHLIGCLDTPTAGTIELDGQSLAQLSSNERALVRAKKIGLVFQSFNLLHNLSAIENVELPLLLANSPKLAARRTARSKLEQVGMTGRAEHRPADMSGGEQQRVAVARALVNDPEIVLADEPTGNLDTETGMQVIRLLVSLRDQGRTALVVTHNPDIAAVGDMLVLFRDGLRVDAEARAKEATS
jgi:putative ABC transport system ATP-binding protein